MGHIFQKKQNAINICNRAEFIQYFEVAPLMLENVLTFFSHHRTDPSWSLVHNCAYIEMLRNIHTATCATLN